MPGFPWLAEVGRTSKAIAPAEEAVAIFEAEAQRSLEEVASSRWDPPWHVG
ncbi:MAG: hypothetical protein O6650_01165 [Actinobacteria bacterium]|nr:hypothetical protein [Actinomycetota bacterium]